MDCGAGEFGLPSWAARLEFRAAAQNPYSARIRWARSLKLSQAHETTFRSKEFLFSVLFSDGSPVRCPAPTKLAGSAISSEWIRDSDECEFSGLASHRAGPQRHSSRRTRQGRFPGLRRQSPSTD